MTRKMTSIITATSFAIFVLSLIGIYMKLNYGHDLKEDISILIAMTLSTSTVISLVVFLLFGFKSFIDGGDGQ